LPIRTLLFVRYPERLSYNSSPFTLKDLKNRVNFQQLKADSEAYLIPLDVVNLMADLIFLPIAGQIESETYLLYDAACGTGGMLTVAEERLQKLAEDSGKEVSIHLYGQEMQPAT